MNRSHFPLILTLELSSPPRVLDDIETYIKIYVSSLAPSCPYFGRWVSALFPNFLVTMVLRIFAFTAHSQLLAVAPVYIRLLVLPLLVPLQNQGLPFLNPGHYAFNPMSGWRDLHPHGKQVFSVSDYY
ncbi:MAG: hypothetical protein AAF063_35435 [Cyanobacteria bacterium J06643_5]